MAERDQLFAAGDAPQGDFVFDDRVVRVFPDMIRRSVPGYSLLLPLIGLLARRRVQQGSQVYDLGCSLGAVSKIIAQSLGDHTARIIGVDNSAAMIEHCRADPEWADLRVPVSFELADIETFELVDASMTVLNFTLQFLQPAARSQLLQRICQATRPGGVLLLAEKLCFDDPLEQQLQTEWHHDFKRAQGYSELEIARKRDALEQVLRPETEQQHLARLQAAGWDGAMRWFQCFNFAAYLAWRRS